MSWMKRPQAGAAPPRPEPQPQAYAAAQPYGNQQSMYPNYQGAPAAAPQQQMWQVPPQQPQYSQQYGQIYQQQPFVSSSNQFFQQPQQYNQNYTNQNFDNVQQGYQQNYYHNQTPQQQNFTQNESSDTWEDNWGWGWEESSKQQKPGNQLPTNQPPPQALAANNANVIEESFTPTQSWNWSMEDKKESESNLPVQHVQNQENNLEASNVANHNTGTVSETSLQQSVSNIPAQDNSNEVKNLSDKDVVKEHLPNLALGKRFHIENLTPQWSIESQMSQDSSDGPLTHSEGTYRSENQSRNSSKSSPGPNTDTSNFNYSLSGFNEVTITNTEISKHSDDSIASNIQNNNRRESYDELANSVKDMSIKNHENTAVDANHHVNNSETIREHKQPLMPPLPSVSPAASVSNQFIPQQPPMPVPLPVSHISQTSSVPAIPSLSSTMHPVQTISPPMNLPPQPSMIPPSNLPPSGMGPPTHLPPPSVGPPTSMPPPPTGPPASMPPSSSALSHPLLTNFPPSSSHNPFKSASPFTHKNIPKIPPPNPQPQAFPTQMPSANLTSPAVVTQILQQDRLSTFGANLETTPDNSERPDQPQMPNYRSMPISQQIPDNLEVAPQNDRNEYLQTAHLSSGDYGENTDFSRNIPPTGLRRMGVGQQEVEYSQGLNISGDEPPPGLARMVPGQQTEVDSSYDQGGDDYMDRQIDGQPMDNSGRPYRQADGQQTPDYTQGSTNRGSDRRPIGLDRMVPGEPSNEEYPQYQTSNFGGANEHRIVTGVDHDYPIPTDAGPPDIREQNVDGSDYTEPTPRNPSRSVIGVREASNATSPDFSLSVDDQPREITMEGENLQDLSSVSAVDFSREAPYDRSNANIAEATKDRLDVADPAEYPMSNSRRQSLNCVTSGEDSGRDRAFKASPRKDRDTNKSSKDRDRDRERDKDRGRYSRGDRKYDRESERRAGKDERRSEATRRERDYECDRRERDDSPGARRHRRSARSRRYETEDTDYYSDRERERRQHREGSYTSSKPPRDTRDERGEHRRRTADPDRRRTADPDRRYDDDRPRRSERHRDRDRDRDRDRFEHRYRDIDPRNYASLRRNKDYKDDDERRKVVTFSGDAKSDRSSSNKGEGEAYSSGSRAGSREATATDEEAEEPRRRAHRDQRRRHRYHHYYEGYDAAAAAAAAAAGAGAGRTGWDEALEVQRRQYEYYERLRRSDPAAYMRLYKQLLTPGLYAQGVYADGYGQTGYEARAEERGSVHSGRSSANGLKPTDTYYGRRDAASMRTDFSDRELTTDMSLNLHLEESTVRSERMTPFKYSTAHVKGSLSARALVVVRAGYPVDGRAPALSVLPLAQLLQRDPQAAELAAYPGPLLKGVTHKKSVVEYCTRRAADAAGAGADAAGHALLWELLALLLRQNGVVVGSDIAELLMKNTKEFDYKVASSRNTESCGSPHPGGLEDEEGETEMSSPPLHCTLADTTPAEAEPAVDEREALERFREYLIYGNRQEALEWAMRCGLWGHALQLAAHGERRARGAVCARFVASLRAADPLHSLYAALAHRTPPAATCVSDERWGDWRPHAAIILANASSKPEADRRTLTQLGDALCARGLPWSAQFCYVSAGVPFGAHPLAPLQRAPPARVAPPRLALLLADSRAASLPRFASNQAIFATEIYEYALSLSQDYVLDELTVYKLMMGTRLADVGQCERALRYAELAARAVTRNPGYYSAALITSIASLADRLKYYDPALQDDAGEDGAAADSVAGDGGEGSEEASPRHQQWLRDVHELAHRLSAQASLQNTPQHGAEPVPANNDQYGWAEQTLQQQQVSHQYADPIQDSTDYPHYQQQHYQPQAQDMEQQYQPEQQYQQEQQYQPEQQYQQEQQYSGYEEPAPQYGADPYWQGDNHYGYHDQPAPPPACAEPGLRRRRIAAAGDARGPLPTHAPHPEAPEGQRRRGGEAPRPTITMPGAAPAKPAVFADGGDERAPSADQTDRETDTPKPNKKPDAKSGDAKGEDKRGRGGGWLGGLFTKLSLRAPNQMILPDDTNPSIVWDEEHKRWRDTDAAEGEAPAPPPPPPALPALPALPAMSTSTPLQSPGAPPTSNIFKMQKSRHIKKSYVDVLNPGGAPRAAPAPLAPSAPLTAPIAAPQNYFIPAPLPPADQIVQVTIPTSREQSPLPTPATAPTQSGMYDPTQMAAHGDDFRSGI